MGLSLWLLFFGLQCVQAASPPLYVFANVREGELGLINTETDQLVLVPVKTLPGWPGNDVVHKQHA